MPLSNPLVGLASGQSRQASSGPSAPSYNQVGSMASSVSPSVGSQPLTGDHNLPIHLGVVIVAALGVVIVLNKAGFRFAVTAGLGK